MIRSSIARPSRPLPFGIVALIMAAAFLIASCGNTTAPSPSATAVPSPSVTPVPSSAPPSPSAAAACVRDDLAVTGGPWGGAAGSRGSDILVENQGSATCLLPAGPTVAIVDQGGTVVLSSAPAQAGIGPELAAGGSIGFSLLVGNWCDQTVSFPLRIQLALASGGIDIDQLVIGTVDDLPPCNGPGQPATLQTTAWEPR
jgi:hypothetical protein